MKKIRKYAAFISYRHCELDSVVAVKVQEKLERFTIPKVYRKNGKKRLGYIFRDTTELPLSNDLTQDIYRALDNSEFLIVICTPETPKSLWVAKEIEYFIQHHGRERVISVLASGTPQISIPKGITHIYSPEGELIGETEPLCANLWTPDDNVKQSLWLLRKEHVRIVAALLDVPFDSLYQRHFRHLVRVGSVIAGIVLSVIVLIISLIVVWNLDVTQKNQEITAKNEEISGLNTQILEQLRQTQLNESKALTLLSRSQLADDNRHAAIESAMAALPSQENERPYLLEAHIALAEALSVYQKDKYRVYGSFTQTATIDKVFLSEDGEYIIVLGEEDGIHCFSAYAQKELWHSVVNLRGIKDALFADEILYLIGTEGVYSFDLLHGELLHELVFDDYSETAVSENGRMLAAASSDRVTFYDIATAETLGTVQVPYYDRITGELLTGAAVEPFQRLSYWTTCQSLSADGATYAAILDRPWFSDDMPAVRLIDAENQKILAEHILELDEPDTFGEMIVPLADGGFAIVLRQGIKPEGSESSELVIHIYFLSQSGELSYICRIIPEEKAEDVFSSYNQISGSYEAEGKLVLVSEHDGIQIDLATETWKYTPWSRCISWTAAENGCLITLSNAGTVKTYIPTEDGLRLESIHQGVAEVGSYVGHSALVQPAYGEWIVWHTNHEVVSYRRIGRKYWDTSVKFPQQAAHWCLSPSGPGLLWYDYNQNKDIFTYGPYCDLKAPAENEQHMVKEQVSAIRVDGLSFKPDIPYFTGNEDLVCVCFGVLMDIHTGAYSLFDAFADDEYDRCRHMQTEDALLSAAKSKDGKRLHWWINGKNHQMTEIPDIGNGDISTLSIDENQCIWLSVVPKDSSAESYDLIYSIADHCWKKWQWDATAPFASHIKPTAERKQCIVTPWRQGIYIYDFDANQLIAEVPFPYPYEQRCAELLSHDRSYLAVTTNDGMAYFIDLTQNQVVFSLETDHFDNPYWYDDYEKNILYFDRWVIDTSTWSVLYEIPEMAAYLPAENSVLCDDGGSLVKCPLYTAEDLLGFGAAYIRGTD